MGATSFEPLGGMPVALRTAMLKVAESLASECIAVQFQEHERVVISQPDEPASYVYATEWKGLGEVDEKGIPLFEGKEELRTWFRVFPLQFREAHAVGLGFWASMHGCSEDALALVFETSDTLAWPLAFIDALVVLEYTARLLGAELKLPSRVTLHLPSSLPEAHRLLLEAYGFDKQGRLVRPDKPRTEVKLVLQASVPDRGIRVSEKEDKWAKLGEQIKNPVVQGWTVQGATEEVLNFFARRSFLVPELKNKQYVLLKRLLEGKPALGVLPAGYGKSLIYHLLSMLLPYPLLVISPLHSLIRDQIYHLQRQGFTAVASVTAEDDRVRRFALYQELQLGRLRLLYISPERLQMRDFYQEVTRRLQQVAFSALVVDEVHCLSEWGHDFRPAYRNVLRFRQVLEEMSGRKIPVLGLTSTASEEVCREVAEVLKIESDDVIRLNRNVQPHISLSVWTASGEEDHSKPTVLRKLIREVFPQLFGVSPDEFLQSDGGYSKAGVIFSMYGAPTGFSSINEGVHAIAEKLRKEVGDTRLVDVYTFAEPLVCPRCRSYLMLRQKQHYKCLKCFGSFPWQQVRRDVSWGARVRQTQEHFQRNKFPLLVATREYGVGIDKQNIRFVIHHTFSTGLEGYYQEIGRAGRDGKHAHVALMYVPPHARCEQEIIRNPKQGLPVPPCVNNYQQCPYGLRTLCDYGRQAIVLQQHYGTVAEEVGHFFKVLKEVQYGSIRVRGEQKIKGTELALYRMQQLGLLEGYSVVHRGDLATVEFLPEYREYWTAEHVLEHLRAFLVRMQVPDVESILADVQQRAHAEASAQPVESSTSSYQPPSFWKKMKALLVREFAVLDEEESQGVPGEMDSESVEREALLKHAVMVLIEQIHATVLHARYRMLIKQLDYAQSKICRRLTLRRALNPADHSISSEYQCGFCDVCKPDLAFEEHQQASVLSEDVELDALIRQLPEILQSFDPEYLEKFVDHLAEHAGIYEAFSRVMRMLEVQYEEPAALFLGGLLASRIQRKQDALRFFYDGWVLAGQLKWARADQWVFIDKALSIAPEEAVYWLLNPENPWIKARKWVDVLQKIAPYVASSHPSVQMVKKAIELEQIKKRLSALKQLKKQIEGHAEN